LVRYKSKSGKYNLERKYEPRNLYRILQAYGRSLNPYRRKPLGMRRGYSSSARARSYTPSRRIQHYQRQSTQPTYRPLPKQSASSYPRIKEEPHYRMPRIEPDTEQMLKQLEQRFDKRLHEQVLEKLETEFEKFREILYKESAEREEIEEMIMKENEAFLKEHKDELIEKLLTGDLDNPEVRPKETNESVRSEPKAVAEENIGSGDSREKLDAGEEVKQRETKDPIETMEAEKAEIETLSDEFCEIDDDLEWLGELDESPPEINEEKKVIEPEQTLEPTSEPIETLVSQEPMEKPEINEAEAAQLENPVEIGDEQLKDLEPILDQIEPIEPEEIKPIEVGIEIAPEILPEDIEGEPSEEGGY